MITITLLLMSLVFPASAAPVHREARVSKVYDGDTVVLDTGERVRVRWVNTPENAPIASVRRRSAAIR